MILFDSIRQILNTFEQDKSEFDEVSNEIIQEYYHIEVDTNSNGFVYFIDWDMLIICDGKLFLYQYSKVFANTFEIDDIMNNDIEYNILKYGKILSEEI